MFEPPLDPLECRILGCLVEKQLSTPDYYPLTLNALLNACNQSSNRDPVLALDEDAALAGLEGLRRRGLLNEVTGAGVAGAQVRTPPGGGPPTCRCRNPALLAELLLRGRQTPGELRSRCARMYPFQDLAEAEAGLEALMEAEVPLALRRPRAAGAREARIAQLAVGTSGKGIPPARPRPPRRRSAWPCWNRRSSS